MNKCKILGVNIDNITRVKAKNTLLEFLNGNSSKIVFTPNPEFIMAAQKDAEFMEILNKSDLNVPDGIGVVIASKFTNNKLPERVAGYDLLQEIFSEIKNTDKTVYFLGGASDIANRAKKAMEEKHQGLKIIGIHNGYFDENEEKLILNQIKELKPDLLLVGIGFPRQEKWIYNHINELPVKVAIGVGGSFDGMCGNVKRAPDVFINLGLEWFYRLLKQPSRIGRMMKLPLFMIKVIFAKINGTLSK